MMYLPRICEHCLNPSCLASCPSGAIYKQMKTASCWCCAMPALLPGYTIRLGYMDNIPLGFKLHTLSAFGLFALWPFTRLVHVWNLPLKYLNRSRSIYRGYNPRKSTK